MTRYWDTRRNSLLPDSRLVYFHQDGILHALACTSTGEISLHLIEENTDASAALKLAEASGVPLAGEMLLNPPFVFSPSAFAGSEIPGLLPGKVQQITVAKDRVLMIPEVAEKATFHGIIPAYHLAAGRAENEKNLVYGFLFKGQLLVIFFRQGELEMANEFTVANDADILYFLVAPVKKAGLRVDEVKFEIMAEPEETRNFLRTADRFLPRVSIAPIELPYIAGEYPPFATIAALLYQYLQCE